MRFQLEFRAPSALNSSPRCARRHAGAPVPLTLLLILTFALATGCAAPTSLSDTPTATATATQSLAPTATLAPEDAFRNEITAITDLRGQIPASRPGFEVERLAAVTILYVFIQLSSPTLPNVQWDALHVQRVLWLGHEYVIPDGWEVSVEFFVPTTNPTTQSLGREIGTANLYTASARRFAWQSLSPQQAWARYDGTAFNPNGV